MAKKHYVPNHRKSHVGWKWEIAASTGGLASLVGMIILLAVYDGKEVSTWHGVTLNAVVSVLSTTSKAMFLFVLSQSIGQWKWVAFSRKSRPLLDLERIDTASRGPLGSVQWLWVSNFQHRSFLQLGAFVTLLAIAVDPFSQQLVQYEQKLKSLIDSSTTIVRAQRFSRGIALVSAVLPITMTSIADYSIQAGILNALIQPYNDIVQQTAFVCPTGNCTSNSFQSLAICHTCNDLRSQLSFYSEPSYLYNDLHKRLNYMYLTRNATSAQLPNGLYINNVDGAPYNMPGDYHPLMRNTSQFLFMTSFGTGNASRTNTFVNSDSLLWAMGFLKVHAPETDFPHSNGWPNVSIDALECGLFYCVNEYSATVRNGILYESETLVHDARRSVDSWSLIDYTYPNLDGIIIDDQSINSLEFNNVTSSWSRTDLMFGDGFNLSLEAVTSLSSQFQSQFTSPKIINISEHSGPSNTLDYTPINGFYKNQIMSYDSSAVEFSPSIMQILYNTSDLNDTFRRLARGLSNAIRAGSDDAEMWTGTSGVMTTYYRIWWPWIALHAVVAFGGMAFLLGTIIGSRASNVPIWKSSTLAMLSLAVSDAIRDTLVGVDILEDMEAKASQHFVQLFDNTSEPDSDAEEARHLNGESHRLPARSQRSEDGIVSEETESLGASH